jgi:hypothetical protein
MWTIIRTSVSTYDDHNRRIDESIEYPTWNQIQSFVMRLDGSLHTEMNIEGLNRYGMAIGGGLDRLTVTVIGEDMGPYVLLGPDSSDETAKIVFGGVLSDLPRRLIVPRKQVLQAAEYFYRNGKTDPNLNWQLC